MALSDNVRKYGHIYTPVLEEIKKLTEKLERVNYSTLSEDQGQILLNEIKNVVGKIEKNDKYNKALRVIIREEMIKFKDNPDPDEKDSIEEFNEIIKSIKNAKNKFQENMKTIKLFSTELKENIQKAEEVGKDQKIQGKLIDEKLSIKQDVYQEIINKEVTDKDKEPVLQEIKHFNNNLTTVIKQNQSSTHLNKDVRELQHDVRQTTSEVRLATKMKDIFTAIGKLDDKIEKKINNLPMLPGLKGVKDILQQGREKIMEAMRGLVTKIWVVAEQIVKPKKLG